jgi:3-oxoadipate CoA-transferase alpha subunit
MIDKRVKSIAEAMQGIKDGAIVLFGGFGAVGHPAHLIDGLIEQGAKDLTLVGNNAGSGRVEPLVRLLATGRVRKIVCSFPRSAGSVVFDEMHKAGKLELELVPQGTLAERIRAGGAGIPAFYTPTAYGTALGEGKEAREINGRMCLLEYAIRADVALIEAWQADRWGNLTYKLSGRNFNPIMATAAELTIVQAQHIVELGEIGPEVAHTPGVYVDRVVHVPYGDPAPALATTA